MTDLSEISLITIITLIISFIIIIIKIILKSKCVNFECLWGCFKVNRDVKIEEDLELYKLKNNIKSNNDLENINNIINQVK
jgi:hypothetical protein